MSPAFPLDGNESDQTIDRPLLWISPVDKKGNSVDPRFIHTALSRVEDLMRYRASDLRDDAVRHNLIEQAVHRASRAKKREAIRDFAAYLFSVFSRLVDEQVKQDKNLIAMDIDCLEDFAARTQEGTAGIEDDIDRRQIRRLILGAMEEPTRWAWERRLCGYELQEIAVELDVTPDCLSTRMRRGLKVAANKLRRHHSDERQYSSNARRAPVARGRTENTGTL